MAKVGKILIWIDILGSAVWAIRITVSAAWRAERAVKAYRKVSPQIQIHITTWKMVNICILIWSNSSLPPQDKKIVIQLVNVCAST